MSDSAVHLAMREIQGIARNKSILVGCLAAGIAFGLLAPFDTAEDLGPLALHLYWIAVAFITFFTGAFFGTFAIEGLQKLGLPKWPSVLLAGAVNSAVILGVVLMFNWVALATAPWEENYLSTFFIPVIGICFAVTTAYTVAKDQLTEAALAKTPEKTSGPVLLDRLPLEKRGSILSLSATDHYVQVATEAGEDLVLIRLSDAIAEAAPITGLRVHRSHWVALDAVTTAKRKGAGAILTLSDGRDIPVSRTYLQEIREAGLLPR